MINMERERDRICRFIKEFVQEDERVVVPVSGGMDSDVVARLCVDALGAGRVKLFLVQQSDMEARHRENAERLAQDLQIPLAVISLERMNEDLMAALEQGEPEDIFSVSRFLDPAKAKCSVRSSVISSYQDKGFLIAGTTNRTEWELGFFLTFGDNMAHFKPVEHLYKSQVRLLGEFIGTRKEVLEQEPSAGFWSGQTDREDLAYWVINDGPILYPRSFSEKEEELAQRWKEKLRAETVDFCLQRFHENWDDLAVAGAAGLETAIVTGLRHIVEKAAKYKRRQILCSLKGRYDEEGCYIED